MRGVFTQDQKQLAFRLKAQGLSLKEIARQVGCTAPMVGLMVRDGRFLTGLPDPWQPRPGRLTVLEREQVLLGLSRGESMSAIARSLGRAPSTVTREVAANGGREGYPAWTPGTAGSAGRIMRRPRLSTPTRAEHMSGRV